MTDRALLSVVVPVFNEAEGIAHFHERTQATLRGLTGLRYEIVYVDDGSHDRSFELLRQFADNDPCVVVIKFSRSFGF